MSKGFFDASEPYATFKAKLQNVAEKTSKIADATLEIDDQPWQTTQKNHGNQSRSFKRWHQTAWGVSNAIALAIKFDCDPWAFTLSSQVTKEKTK